MKRIVPMAALALVLAVPAHAAVQTYYGFQIGVTNAPPPTRLVVRERPRISRVEATDVYVVNEDDCDADVFRFGMSWYWFNDGYWYRATRLDGPFRAMDVRYVPRPVLSVRPTHWKHHPRGGPPGLRERECCTSDGYAAEAHGDRCDRGHRHHRHHHDR